MATSVDLMTAAELAEHLRVKPSTVKRWSRLGLIPTVRLSPKLPRFNLAEAVKALQLRGKQLPGNKPVDGAGQ